MATPLRPTLTEQPGTHAVRDRPDPAFPISLRTGWDPQGMEPERIRDELAGYEAAGVQHVVSAPWRNNLDDWLRSMDLLAELVG